MTCQKISYPARRDAAAAANAAGRRPGYIGKHTKEIPRRKSRASLRPYLCPSCGEWHLSSRPQHASRNQSRQEDV